MRSSGSEPERPFRDLFQRILLVSRLPQPSQAMDLQHAHQYQRGNEEWPGKAQQGCSARRRGEDEGGDYERQA